jgi:hypothetical protein
MPVTDAAAARDDCIGINRTKRMASNRRIGAFSGLAGSTV